MSKDEILDKIRTLTGGRAAEEFMFNICTSGASNDIEQATRLARAMVAQLGADERDLEDIASFVGQVEGVKNAITIRELRPGTCKLSLRTDPEVLNASRVCALLGGGGHAAASGATVEGSVEEAKRAILWAIEQVRHG